jgi:hypothetical protein
MVDIDNNVSELYLGFFGRPGDPVGAQYWNGFIEDELAADRGIDGIEQELAARFADSPEARNKFAFLDDPANGNLPAFIDAVYQNLFNRDAEDAGQTFWQSRFQEMLDGGMGVDRAASQFVIEILNAAQGGDAGAVQNKVAAASEYTERFIETDAVFTVSDDLTAAEDMVAAVGASDDSRQQASTRIDEILDANLTASGVVTDGYVRDAEVGVDTNGDGVLQDDEVLTTTDENGGFDFGEDQSGEILARGGTDVTTGEPVTGGFSAPEGSTVVSPLTTLIDRVQQQRGGSSADAEAAVKRAFGLQDDVDLKSFDSVAALSDDDPDNDAAGLQVQKTVAQVVNTASIAANAANGATGSDDTNSSANRAFDALAGRIAGTGDDETVDLTDSDTVQDVVRDTVSRTAEDTGAEIDEQTLDTVAEGAGEVARAANQSTADASDFQGIARAQKVAQSDAGESVRQGAVSGDFTETTDNFTGDNFDDAADDQAEVDVLAPGDADGDGDTGDGDDTNRTSVSLDGAGSTFDAGDDRYKLTDDANTLSAVTVSNFSDDDRITIDNPASVNFTATTDQVQLDIQDTDGNVSEIDIPVASDPGVVTDEASAEAALGFDAFDFSLVDDSGPEARTLDTMGDTVDAGGDDFAFTEDAAILSAVEIQNFGSGDSIEIVNAASVNFTSTGNEVQVDIQDSSGSVSEIDIVGVSNPGVVTDEAGAESALGFDAFTIA